ncbi:hypothetical protein OG216_29235 [Streptomycetaceae bacterium NBC_01309]
MRARRIAAVASATLLAAVALSACGSDDGGADNTKTDAKALADQVVEHAKKKGSMEALGKGVDEDGKPYEVKSCVNIGANGKSESVKGSMTIDGVTAEVLFTGGKQYTKAGADFFQMQMGEDGAKLDVAAFNKSLGGKWLVDEDEPDDEADFFDGNTDGLTKGEVMEFNGKKVVPLVKKENDTEKTVYIAAKGDPVVVGMVEVEGKERTETTVTGVGTKCDVQAPPQDQTLTQDEFETAYDEARGAA